MLSGITAHKSTITCFKHIRTLEVLTLSGTGTGRAEQKCRIRDNNTSSISSHIMISASRPSMNDKAMPCIEVNSMYDTQVEIAARYPKYSVVNGTVDGWIAVKADFTDSAPRMASGFALIFGTAGWLALFIHAAGVTISLRPTPREGGRLRALSHQRQLEAGLSIHGSSGLTSDRWRNPDAWEPP